MRAVFFLALEAVVAELQVALWRAVQDDDLAKARDAYERLQFTVSAFYADPLVDSSDVAGGTDLRSTGYTEKVCRPILSARSIELMRSAVHHASKELFLSAR